MTINALLKPNQDYHVGKQVEKLFTNVIIPMLKVKRKSGNGTTARQWLYLYINIPLVILFKIGISGNYKRRAKQVSRKGFGTTVPVFAVRIPFAFQCEQAMHRLFRLFNIRYGGSREWYLFPVAPLAFIFMLFALAMDWMVVIMGVVLAMWLLQHY